MEKGFTLVEMLLVVLIIAVMSSISFQIYKQGEVKINLQRTANKIVQDIKRVQEMAIATKEFRGIIPRGYGVYFNLSHSEYTLFADCDSDGDYDKVGNPCNGFPEKIKKVEIEKEVKISSLSPSSPLTVIFLPPDPITEVNHTTSTLAEIILQSKNSTTSIKILPTGLIYAE